MYPYWPGVTTEYWPKGYPYWPQGYFYWPSVVDLRNCIRATDAATMTITLTDAGLLTVTVTDTASAGGAVGSASYLITKGIGAPGGITPFVLLGLNPSRLTSPLVVTVSDGIVVTATASDALVIAVTASDAGIVTITATDGAAVTVTVSDAGACSTT